jgi:hypothetical protein
LIIKALGHATLKNRLVVAWNKDLNAPVALAEDLEQLAGMPQLLAYALTNSQKANKRLHSAADLSKKLSGSKKDQRLQQAFAAAVVRQCEADALPPGVGAVMDGQPKFFFLEDLLPESVRRRVVDAGSGSLSAAGVNQQRPSSPAPAQSEPSAHESFTAQAGQPRFADFARRFEEIFSRLDRQHGGHNFVSLAELRRELNAFSRADFDAHLRRLRVEHRFTLSSAQSKTGLSEDVREAGIPEAGQLLTYVSRRK